MFEISELLFVMFLLCIKHVNCTYILKNRMYLHNHLKKLQNYFCHYQLRQLKRVCYLKVTIISTSYLSNEFYDLIQTIFLSEGHPEHKKKQIFHDLFALVPYYSDGKGCSLCIQKKIRTVFLVTVVHISGKQIVVIRST